MSKKQKLIITLFLILAFIMGYKVNSLVINDVSTLSAARVEQEEKTESIQLSSSDKRKIIYNGINNLKQLINDIDNNYYKDVDINAMFDDIYKAVFKSLDPHSFYISEKEKETFDSMITGKFYGIGAVVSKIGDFAIINKPIVDSPAEKAGLLAGDKILEVDGKDITPLSLQEVVNNIRGEKNTIVTLKIQRGDSAPLEFKVKRGEVKDTSVTYKKVKGENVITITGFIESTTDELTKIMKENNLNNGIIFDLRGNPGGYLQRVVEICDMFLPKGDNIVTVKYKQDNKNQNYISKKEGYKMPMMVIIDENSASAAEIFAGNMKSHKRAIIVGENSFGKGTVQDIKNSVNNGELKLTVAEYFVNKNVKINEVGVAPDYEFKSDLTDKYNELTQFSKKDLKFGENGKDVIALKERLNILGYNLNLNEEFDKETKNAYREVLEKNGIKFSDLTNDIKIKLETLVIRELGKDDTVLNLAIKKFKEIKK